MSSVLTRTDNTGVATLTMERPQARNALSMELMTALLGALEAISKDTSVKAVILRGAGPAFCAGHDLKELRANPGRAFMRETFETCARLMLAITRLRQPVIAQVHGIATAAGCQLVATCDLAVCADDARFATPGVNIGLFCSTPMVALTRAVGRKAAMKMLLTGDMIDAAEAIRIGLVNAAVASSKLHETAEALAAQIASKSGPVLAIGKEAFSRQIEMSLEEAYTYAGQVMTENMMLRDAAEGIDAFLEKRKPTWCD
jgi:enoyl-CoA hydratase/carnithine racemase